MARDRARSVGPRPRDPPGLRGSGPGPRAVEHAQIAADLELAVFNPDLCLVDLAVTRVQDRAVLVPIALRDEIPHDHEPDDRLVLVITRALSADLGMTLRVVWLGDARDPPVDLAAPFVDLDLRSRLAALLLRR